MGKELILDLFCFLFNVNITSHHVEHFHVHNVTWL